MTAELTEMLTDRIPEFLAILVNHAVGGQTLDPTLPEFEKGGRRGSETLGCVASATW